VSEDNEMVQVQEAMPAGSVDGAFVAPQPGPPAYEDEQSAEVDGPLETSYVYALGRIEPRFPSIAIEKEFVQATGRAETAGLTDRQALQEVLSERSNRYLARMLCWVLTVEGLDSYVLAPRDPGDLDLLVDALRPTPRPTDVDVVIGTRAGITPPELCNGLMVPMVVYDQLYSFDVDALLESIPRPDDADETQFSVIAEEVLWRILQLADNAGASDEHRALNYLAVRYPAIYAKAAAEYAANATLTRVDVRPSRLSGVRNIVDAIFSFTQRQTDVTQQFFVRVDVTEAFPFLITKLMPYYER